MSKPSYESALIVGAGEGLSASLARLFAREGMRIALAARRTDKLAGLAGKPERRFSPAMRQSRTRSSGSSPMSSARGARPRSLFTTQAPEPAARSLSSPRQRLSAR